MIEQYKPARASEYVNVVGQNIEELEGKISTLEQIVSNLQGQINMKVDRYGIINSINMTEEGIRIKGSKIYMDKETLIEHGVIK